MAGHDPHARFVLKRDVRIHLFGKPLYTWELVVKEMRNFPFVPCHVLVFGFLAGQPHRLQVLPYRRVAHPHPEFVQQ